MLKWERKLIEFLEKHMLLLAALFISGIALLLRRQNIWFHTEDYIYYFDMHENHIQTPLYYLLVKLAGYGFDLPLHGIKWIAGLADFAVAFLAVLYCGKVYGKLPYAAEKVRLLLLYAACLFAPVVYVRGCVWAQIDSLAFMFMLGGACLLEYFGEKGMVAAVILAAVGVAFYPPFWLLVIWYCLAVIKDKGGGIKYCWLIVAGIAVVLEILSGICLELTWGQSLLSLLNWAAYHPHTGVVYKSPGDWMWQQVLMFSYSISVVSLIAAFGKKLSRVVAVILQIVLAMCVGIALGW